MVSTGLGECRTLPGDNQLKPVARRLVNEYLMNSLSGSIGQENVVDEGFPCGPIESWGMLMKRVCRMHEMLGHDPGDGMCIGAGTAGRVRAKYARMVHMVSLVVEVRKQNYGHSVGKGRHLFVQPLAESCRRHLRFM